MTSSLAPTSSHASRRRLRKGVVIPLWAPEAIELAALALRRTARAGFPDRHTWEPLDDRNRRADAFVDEGYDLEDALAFDERFDAVADLHRRRCLGRDAVDANMTATARRRRRRTALVEADGP